MNRRLGGACWLAAAALCLGWTASAHAVTELLINGEMDSTSVSTQLLATPDLWVAEADTDDGLSSEPWNNVAGPDGKGVFFKTFRGTPEAPYSAALYQDVTGTPGLTYLLTGWVGAGPGYSGLADAAGPTRTVLALDFLDASSALLASSEQDLNAASGLGAGSGPGFGYDQFSVAGAAPTGTAVVRARFSMIDGYAVAGAGDAALVVDAFSLSVVPEPTALLLACGSLLGLAAQRRRR